MKVALFTDTCSPQINGVTNTLNKLTEYFDRQGVEYKVLAPKYEEDEVFDAERFYSLKFWLYPECRLALPNIFRVSRVLGEFKPDLIHLMTEFNMGLTGLAYGNRYRIPTISNYTTNFSQYTNYYKVDFLTQIVWDYMTWFHNQNRYTLCASEEAKKLLHGHGIRNTALFSRGIDTEAFNQSFRSDAVRRTLGLDGKITFLYVGRVSPEKDLDVLAKSYNRIKKEYGDKVALVITGEGPYLDHCQEIFPEDTVFTGFKKGQELSEIYASCDIFVCPSSTETFGNVVQEAMGSGLAVIGANAGGVKNLIEHRQNGLKFEAGDACSLYSSMKELIDNKLFSEYLKSNGMEFVKERSWDNVFNDLMDIYYEVSEIKQDRDIHTA